MTKTHWRKILETDYLGGFDLDDGKGNFREIDATIKKAERREVKDQNGNNETCLVIEFTDKDIKPMILNVTNSRMLEKLFKSSYIEDWEGKTIRIGTEKVRAFGEWHNALRIRNFIPKPKNTDIICSDCGGVVKGRGKATAQIVADNAVKEFGQPVCLDCWEKRKEITRQYATDLSDAEERHVPVSGGMLGELPDPKEA